jgi:hypothetical protein
MRPITRLRPSLHRGILILRLVFANKIALLFAMFLRCRQESPETIHPVSLQLARS